MPNKSTGRGRNPTTGAWNLREICELIDVLVERQINEFEMEKGGIRIRIKRGSAGAEMASSPVYGNNHAPSWPATPTLDPPHSSPAPGKHDAPEIPESAEDLHLVKSPIVGTYYNAPSPSAPPFVTVGDVVQVGQPLCIIEAMKLMNEIESDVDGEVTRCYVENGQPVEYGQALFAIRPSHKK